ncbi:hypothetical protein L208DRAFT_1382733 [Tricholoma matsutake]|nr:hypothetical protein L208DRAFT_1382733 [Tricholoma matsutake 945]
MSDNDSNEEEENGDSIMSKKDEELAHLCGKLEKRWSNDRVCPPLEAPKHPVQSPLQNANLDSPIVYTPTKLTQYLKHQQNLAQIFLTQVKNQTLVDLGISHGDAIWLKQGASNWWTGLDAKSLKYKAVNDLP